ncbi:aspartate aminotransferase [Candidatus Methanoplasma termitum]|uniref:Aminotransferase n=1 Tax=Candidatus Methanoplasma termitum TaxID=1577791 RepID=A0A0A7LAH5_9ARCH|nr:histidinol-phosphate transaminase [Candidatus Methanoplasma termitum]AIZ56125.1 aspartate aminotransferase [Candidatus Methanoplasma termitum]
MKYGRKVLTGIPKTVHGGQAWKMKGIEDYSHNLNPFGPPEFLHEIVSTAMEDVGHYPDDNCTELKATLSKIFSLKEENIAIGSGSSEIIRNFPNAFIESGEKAVINRPSFAEYSQQCRLVGAKIEYNELSEEGDFRIDPKGLSSALKKDVKALYICNPNNPTGRIEHRSKILEIVKECQDKGILVFLDETLLELVPNHEEISCAGFVKKYDNLVIAGSLTKSFAIPGIRIGYGMASQHLIEEMDKVRMTWNVGQIEQNVARILMSEHMDYVHKAAAVMAKESKTMHSQLKALGFPIGNVTDSFFYFCSLKEIGIKCAEFQKLMLKEKIMVRDCSSFGERFDSFVRFSVKDRERNEMFVKAVERTMERLG